MAELNSCLSGHSLSSQHVVRTYHFLGSELVKLVCIIPQAIQPPMRKTLLFPTMCQLGTSHTASGQQIQTAESVDSSLVTPWASTLTYTHFRSETSRRPTVYTALGDSSRDSPMYKNLLSAPINLPN